MDLAKSFDTVPIPILPAKIESMGARESQLSLLVLTRIGFYLSDRTQIGQN